METYVKIKNKTKQANVIKKAIKQLQNLQIVTFAGADGNTHEVLKIWDKFIYNNPHIEKMMELEEYEMLTQIENGLWLCDACYYSNLNTKNEWTISVLWGLTKNIDGTYKKRYAW